jgi:hypothetical protein
MEWDGSIWKLLLQVSGTRRSNYSRKQREYIAYILSKKDEQRD